MASNIFHELLEKAPDNVVKSYVLELLPAEGGTMFSGLMLTLNGLLAGAAVAWLFWQVLMHVILFGIAKSREAGSDRPEIRFINDGNIIGYLRSLGAIALLIPGASGLNLWNYFVISLALAASNLGQIGWDKGTDTMFSVQQQPSPLLDRTPVDMLTYQLVASASCYHYLRIEETAQFGQLKKFDDGLMEFEGRKRFFESMKPMPDCGSFKLGDPGKVKDVFAGMSNTAFIGPGISLPRPENIFSQTIASAYKAKIELALNRYMIVIDVVASRIAAGYYPRTAAKHPFDAEWAHTLIEDAKKAYMEAERDAFGQLRIALFKLANTSRHNKDGRPWHLAGGYYARYAEANHTMNKMRELVAPTVQPALWQEIWGANPPAHVTSFIDAVNDFNRLDNPLLLDQKQDSSVPQIDGNSLVTMALKFFNDRLVDFNITTDDNVSAMTLVGEYANYYTALASAAIGTKIYLGVNPLTITVHSAIGGILETLAYGFGLLAGTFTFVIPLLPWFFFSLALFSYGVQLLILTVAGSVAILLNVRVTGTELVVGTIWQGLISLFLRPIVMLIALTFSFKIFNIGVGWINVTLTPALNSTSIGSFGALISFIIGPFVHSILVLVLAFACFSLIKILPDRLDTFLLRESLKGGNK